MSLNVLVTGAGGASGLYSIKILKETTIHRIIAADASPYSPGLFLADACYLLPFARDEQQYLEVLSSIVIDEGVDVIIPNVDEELPLLARPAVQQGLGAKVVVSPLETIQVCEDKSQTVSRLSSTVPCPETFSAHEADFASLKFPVHVKPRRGRGSRFTQVVEDIDSLTDCIRRLSPLLAGEDPILIQEFLPGAEYTVDLLCDLAGRPLVVVPRIRIRTSGGLSVQGQTVRDQNLIEQVRKIAGELRFYGPVNLQFKENDQGIAKLLEINPRFAGGLPISCAAGANGPALLLHLLENEDVDWDAIQRTWQEGVVLRYFEEVFFPLEEWNNKFPSGH